MMIPEPTERYLMALNARLTVLEDDNAAMTAYLDLIAPHWRSRVKEANAPIETDDAPGYLWGDRPVKFVSPAEGGMALVELASGNRVTVKVSELKPWKESDS